MRKLAICTAGALVLSTSFALAQGSGAAGDIGSGTLETKGRAQATEPGTVGQGSASQPSAPAPKAAKAAKKKTSEN